MRCWWDFFTEFLRALANIDIFLTAWGLGAELLFNVDGLLIFELLLLLLLFKICFIEVMMLIIEGGLCLFVLGPFGFTVVDYYFSLKI